MKYTKVFYNGIRQENIYLNNTAFEVQCYKAKRKVYEIIRFVIGFSIGFGLLWIVLFLTQGI